MNDIPQWLKEALAQPRPTMPKPVQAPVERGDIRLASREGVASQFVLVHEALSGYVTTTMLSNEVDLVADYTTILEPQMTGLPFALLCTNIVGPVFASQLSGRYAHIDAELTEGLWRAALGNSRVFHDYPNLKRGMPFHGPVDPRWNEYVRMLQEWQPLCADALREAIGDE